MNIRFAIACFFILFGLAQFWGWMQQFSLEEPTFVLGGILLAAASNFNRRAAFPFDLLHQWLAQRSTDRQTPNPPTDASPQDGLTAD